MHYYCIWRGLKSLMYMKIFHHVYVTLVGNMQREHSTEMNTVHTD